MAAHDARPIVGSDMNDAALGLTVVVAGAESTGKTTLAGALADAHATSWVPEYAREYLNGRTTYGQQDLVHIARGQWRREQAARAATPGLLVVDTDWLVIRIWSQVKYATVPEVVNDHMRAAVAAGQRGYLVPRPDIPWQFDPLRENPDDRVALHALYIAALDELGLPYVELHGTHTQRLRGALAAVTAWQRR